MKLRYYSYARRPGPPVPSWKWNRNRNQWEHSKTHNEEEWGIYMLYWSSLQLEVLINNSCKASRVPTVIRFFEKVNVRHLMKREYTIALYQVEQFNTHLLRISDELMPPSWLQYLLVILPTTGHGWMSLRDSGPLMIPHVNLRLSDMAEILGTYPLICFARPAWTNHISLNLPRATSCIQRASTFTYVPIMKTFILCLDNTVSQSI